MTDGSVPRGEGEVLLDRDRVNLGDAADFVESEGVEHIHGFFVHLDVVGVDGGDVWDKVLELLPLLLLQLERDAANRTLLDPFHEMCGETCDLVPQLLRGDDRHFF
ncbi:hypothetical protein VNO80_27068 [Phaseolus coccineus]|uniref:Uncharacterized protein n=1 Tax=Phaseolus coccineus TaxID=3886 RepID=A0AAN9LFY1_PHACN